jgi:hypothetical protein
MKLHWQTISIGSRKTNHSTALDSIDGESSNLTGTETPERLQGFLVTASFFDVTGIKPVQGRTFLPEENQPGRDAVVVITNGLWQAKVR